MKVTDQQILDQLNIMEIKHPSFSIMLKRTGLRLKQSLMSRYNRPIKKGFLLKQGGHYVPIEIPITKFVGEFGMDGKLFLITTLPPESREK